MKILVTAFEPFGTHTINPTQQIVEQLAANPPTGTTVVIRHLPVVADQALQLALEAFENETPDAMIALGLAENRARISLERVAINVDDFRIPDNSGVQLCDVPIVPGGPIAYWSLLPVRRLLERLQAENIPAEISNSAGTYVCNHLFYGVLHHLHQKEIKKPFGFIHVPRLPEQLSGEDSTSPSLPLETMIQALQLCLESLVEFGLESRIHEG